MSEQKKLKPDADQQRMLATSLNSVAVPVYGTTLKPQDSTLLAKGRSKGIRLYDEVMKDGHAQSVLNKRIRKVVSREWMMQPASDSAQDVAAADMVTRMLKGFAFDKLCGGLLEATLYGYSPAEVVWQIKDNEVIPADVVPNHPARIVFDKNWQPRLITAQEPMNGEAQPERKWIIHRVGDKNDDPYGSGLGRTLFWHVLFKREGVGFWAHFLEKYASPTPFGKYPLGTPPSEQERLMQHLADMVQRGVLVAPLGTEVSFLEAARTGAATYEEWCNFWNAETSVTVLGETLSTNIKGAGARAAAQTHDSISDMIATADSDLLSDTLNKTLIQWIIDFNMPGAGCPTIWRPMPRNEEALEDVKIKKADRVTKNLNNLFELRKQGFEPKAGLEQALSDVFDFEIVAVKQPDLKGDMLNSTALSPAFAVHDHGIGSLAEQLDEAARSQLDAWLARIRQEIGSAVAKGDSLASFSDQLLALHPELEVDQYGQIISQALTVAEATGRADVQDEIS